MVGSFFTAWGKRRVKRNPEQILPCSLPLSKDFDVAVTRSFVDRREAGFSTE
jgi:hypothetical protein